MSGGRWSRRRGAVTVGVLAVLALAMTAKAQEQAAPAESMFEEGRALLAQKRYPEACAKFAESEKLDPAVGTLLNLGDCYEKMGKIATAWAVFKEATVMAHGAKQPARERIAAARALNLEPSVPRLSIAISHAVTGLEVRRDGRVIGEAEWSGAVPSAVTVDPGEHEIVVVAPGKKAWTTKVTLAADGKTTAVVVPELDADELADRAPLNPASATGVSIEAVNTHDRNVQRGIGIAVGGVGLVSILVSIPFGVRGINLNKTAASECPTNSTCTTQGQNDSQSAVTSGLVSTLLFSIGAGVVVGGAVVFFTAPSAKPKSGKNFQLMPEVGRGSGGLRLVGSF